MKDQILKIKPLTQENACFKNALTKCTSDKTIYSQLDQLANIN